MPLPVLPAPVDDPPVDVPLVPGVVGIVPGVVEPGRLVLVPETPVAGGVVDAPGPVPGAHGTAVPLVPTVDGVVAELEPVLRDVLLVAVLLPDAVPDADAVVLPVPVAPALDGGAPLLDSGPVSVAVFTPSFAAVGVPVELLIRLVGDAGFVAPVVPAAEAEPAPVTGTHGIVVGVAVGDVRVAVPGCVAVPGVVLPDCGVPAVLLPDCVAGVCVDEVPDVAGFCAAITPTDNAAANAALLVINTNRFFI